MAGNIFFVTRLKPEAKFAEFISGFMSRVSPDVQIRTVRYKNHNIMIAAGKSESLTIGYTSFNNLLVFGIGDKAAKAGIDVVTKNQKSLAEDKAVREIGERTRWTLAESSELASAIESRTLKHIAD